MGDGEPKDSSRLDPADAQPTAKLEPQVPSSNVLVNVTTDHLNLHPSNLSALERIAERNPEIAAKLIDSADKAIALDARKYSFAAAGAALVALSVIIGSAVVIVESGPVAGLFFFLACVAACSLMTVLFTGKAQDISWTIDLLPHRKRDDDAPD